MSAVIYDFNRASHGKCMHFLCEETRRYKKILSHIRRNYPEFLHIKLFIYLLRYASSTVIRANIIIFVYTKFRVVAGNMRKFFS